MPRRITDWLRSETLPRNAYELLGHPLFDPDRDAMLQTLRASNREILDYQSHPEPAIAKRAIHLLMELGRYRGILEDSAKSQAYVDDLCKTLREQFVAERGPLALHAGNDLGAWLGLAYGVPSAQAEAAMKAVRGTVPPPQSLPKRGSKFGAFHTPAPEPIQAEVLELIEPPPEVVRPAVYDLSEAPPSPLPPPPPRKPARLEPVDPVPRKLPKREKEPSIAVPLAIGGGVLMLLAVITAIVIVMSGDSDKSVKNDPPPEQKTPAPETPPEVDPPLTPPMTPPEVTPPSVTPPVVPKKPPTTPAPSQAELERIKREADAKKEMARIAALKEMERIAAEKKEMARLAAERKEMERLAAEKREMERIEAERKDNERNPWIAAAGVKQANLPKVQDVRMRVRSATVKKLTDTERNAGSDHPLLVVWAEVANHGANVIQYRRLIDYQSKADDYFQYCFLRDPSNLQAPQLKRADWLTLDRKLIRELPDWFDDESPNRMIPPKGRAFIPIVFEPGKSEGKDLTLTIDAMRIVNERGKDMEYGQFILLVRDHHWKAASPVP